MRTTGADSSGSGTTGPVIAHLAVLVSTQSRTVLPTPTKSPNPMPDLTRDQRRALEATMKTARDLAEAGAADALRQRPQRGDHKCEIITRMGRPRRAGCGPI